MILYEAASHIIIKHFKFIFFILTHKISFKMKAFQSNFLVVRGPHKVLSWAISFREAAIL